MVLPATFALGIATLRQLQPRQYQPARISWMIFEWMGAHLTRTHAAFMFLILPALAFLTGSRALLRIWHQDDSLRRDALAFLSGAWRNIHAIILAAGTLVGAAILMAAVIHMITD